LGREVDRIIGVEAEPIKIMELRRQA
jgi:hypothetical protein